MVSSFKLVLQLLSLLRLAAGVTISMPNCTDRCGNVEIPYPFGIGVNCFHDSSYEIICNASFTPPKPFLLMFNSEVLDINWPGRYAPWLQGTGEMGYILKLALPPLNLCGSDGGKRIRSYDLKGSPYRFSKLNNVLMMEGCGGSAILKTRNGKTIAGCASICDSDTVSLNRTTCYSDGCCQASIRPSSSDHDYKESDKGLDYYEIDVGFQQQMKSNSCNASVALVDIESMKNIGTSLSTLETFPKALEWYATWVADIPFYKMVNITCENFTCNCIIPYEGNPYVPDGCQGN